ncbi:hypothetical protein [Nocardiopsis synnemataformans]|uniref:hypothetical protein n=1 Tax=Nocardiopsis synnemataformans TaxID=61305 RepID=UPI003EBDDFA9
MADEALIFRAEEAAARLKLNPDWLRRKAGRREIPVRIIGGEYGWTAEDLAEIVDLFKKPMVASAQSPLRRQKKPRPPRASVTVPGSVSTTRADARPLRPRTPYRGGAA